MDNDYDLRCLKATVTLARVLSSLPTLPTDKEDEEQILAALTQVLHTSKKLLSELDASHAQRDELERDIHEIEVRLGVSTS